MKIYHDKKLVELTIDSIGFQGVSIGRIDNVVHFVSGAVPKDRVIASLHRKKSNYYECNLEEIIEPSPDRVAAKCTHFGDCGGCKWQHLDYQQQVFWKRRHIMDAFVRNSKIEVGLFHETLQSPKIFYYRNKMEFSFSASRWLTSEEISATEQIERKNFALGLHIPGLFDKVLDIDECHIFPERGNKILHSIRKKALELDVTALNQREQTGFLKNLVVRHSEASGEMMVNLITNQIDNENEQNFIDWYKSGFIEENDFVSTHLHSVNATTSPVAKGETEVLSGSGYITESILGIKYKISPYSFFQTNSCQLDNFISSIVDFARINGDETIWDLYCGTGSITLPAAKKTKSIIGLELVAEAIDDAKNNAVLNNIENTDFYNIDLHTKQIPEFLNNLPKPDIIIIDPPRAGTHKNLINHLLTILPKRIVYVSCNPSTQARDCEVLSQYYTVEEVLPVDMFPHTYHIESVARLELKNS
jgi:23S rRNA (uracil1939-C5)-methyltransferase